MKSHDDHEEAAIYWSAVSLIICEGLPVQKAARKLGMSVEQLKEILQRRQDLGTQLPYPPTRPIASATG